MKAQNSQVSRFIRYGANLLAALVVCFGLYQTWLQSQENQYLQQVAQTLKTGDASKDIEAAVNYAYTHINLGDGKQGFLRSTALEILNPSVGGQCGEYTRFTILLLEQMGYSARRVYLFPTAPTGETFDPKEQPSFHVMGEVWVGDRWAAIDPLHGFVFYKQPGEFATVADLAADPAIINNALRIQPVAIHTTTFGTIDKEIIRLDSSKYENTQRINWTYLTRIPGLFPLVRGLLGSQLNTFSFPVVAERPHELLALGVFCLAALVYGLGWIVSRQLELATKPSSNYLPASQTGLATR